MAPIARGMPNDIRSRNTTRMIAISWLLSSSEFHQSGHRKSEIKLHVFVQPDL